MINPNLEIACEILTRKSLYGGGISHFLDEMTILGLQYRKNKNIGDVHNAISRGQANGHGKSEMELSMATLYLSKVLKIK